MKHLIVEIELANEHPTISVPVKAQKLSKKAIVKKLKGLYYDLPIEIRNTLWTTPIVSVNVYRADTGYDFLYSIVSRSIFPNGYLPELSELN